MDRYRLVIFDFDGTLCDSASWFASVYGEVARRFGLREVTGSEFESLRGLPNREIVRRLGVPRWKMPFIAAHMRRLAARDSGSLQLFPGIEELLLSCKEREPQIAIVSSNAEANVRRVLGPALSARISHFGCGAGLFGKPAKFRATLRRLGIPADQALAIGDEARDIEAARAVGIAAGAVAWGYASPRMLQAMRPDVFLEEVTAIGKLLLPADCTGQKRQ